MNPGFHPQWGATGNEASLYKKLFAELLNTPQNVLLFSNSDHCINQNVNNHENFDDVNDPVSNSDKLAALIPKLSINQAAGKDEILAEHITVFSFSFQCAFNAWTNSLTVHENCYYTYLQK